MQGWARSAQARELRLRRCDAPRPPGARTQVAPASCEGSRRALVVFVSTEEAKRNDQMKKKRSHGYRRRHTHTHGLQGSKQRLRPEGRTSYTCLTGFKGFFPCNGVLGMSGGTTTAATETADEVEVVVSGDPGGDTVIVLKFLGISSSSDAS